MPIYEYQCSSCGELLEALQKVSDAPLVDCPACGKATLRKKVSAAAFRLKGSGWYETDFKSGSKKNLAGDEGTGGTKDGAGAAKDGAGGTKDAGGSGQSSEKQTPKADAKPGGSSDNA
jgi:putative FmdB family regulatory protein